MAQQNVLFVFFVGLLLVSMMAENMRRRMVLIWTGLLTHPLK
jgi:hypothetical protein